MPAAPAIPRSLTDLSPSQARLCLDVERFLLSLTGPEALRGKTLVSALSLGADSTALTLILRLLGPRLGFDLAACHLDHGLRPKSADEARRVTDFCRELDIACLSKRTGVAELAKARGLGLEEAGRQARRTLYRQARKKFAAAYVCLAHQQDDLAEDVLMRLIRGTGWPGLGGMPGLDDNTGILRPLLHTSRERIEAFLHGLQIPWTEDPSNDSPEFTRNRIRGALTPLVREENPNWPRAASRLWRLARVEEDYWERQTRGAILPEEAPGALRIAREALKDAHPALRLRLFKTALDRLGPGESRAETLFALEAAFCRGSVSGTFQFPGAKTARLTASGVVFSKATERDPEEI